ncbi:MAG: hypothetical protein MZW92_56600 [Comamonadaceae bacterium]|nr:hypothetical protein [Comamonadaceae bacterium]
MLADLVARAHGGVLQLARRPDAGRLLCGTRARRRGAAGLTDALAWRPRACRQAMLGARAPQEGVRPASPHVCGVV